jgi:hypothetical protein
MKRKLNPRICRGCGQVFSPASALQRYGNPMCKRYGSRYQSRAVPGAQINHSQNVRVWECKIVVPADEELPDGFDLPPRRAAIDMIEKHGVTVLACFSGWGGVLTEAEKKAYGESK